MRPTNSDLYTRVANRTKIPRKEVKRKCLKIMYAANPQHYRRDNESLEDTLVRICGGDR